MVKNLFVLSHMILLLFACSQRSWSQIKIVPLEKSSPAPEEKTAGSDQNLEARQAQEAQDEPRTISELLAQTKGYQKGDPLTWEIVSPVIQKLRKAGMQLPPDSELQKKFLNENDPFYRMLSSNDGRRFFRDLSQSPASIDRAERYLSFKNGRKELSFIMSRKGGAELFTDMVNTQNGRSTARMMCRDSKSCEFNQSTGKIYLESQLISFLKKSASEQLASEQEKSSTTSTVPTPRKYD